jgi:hypothetical protein
MHHQNTSTPLASGEKPQKPFSSLSGTIYAGSRIRSSQNKP